MQLSGSLLDRLARIDTPTICNVIEYFNVRSRVEGYTDGTLIANFPELPPMIGYATTVKYTSSATKGEKDVYASLEEQAEIIASTPAPRIVVFEDVDNPATGASFGEVLITSYQSMNCAGLVTSGAGRDIQQIKSLHFPIFTTSTICSHGYARILELNTPVKVCGLQVNPGDLLHGDCNGVTNIPLEIAEKIAEPAEKILEIEAELLKEVSDAQGDVDAFVKARQNAGKKFEALAQEIQSG